MAAEQGVVVGEAEEARGEGLLVEDLIRIQHLGDRVPQQVVEIRRGGRPLGDAAVAEEALDALGGRGRGLLGEDRAEDGVERGRGAGGTTTRPEPVSAAGAFRAAGPADTVGT